MGTINCSFNGGVKMFEVNERLRYGKGNEEDMFLFNFKVGEDTIEFNCNINGLLLELKQKHPKLEKVRLIEMLGKMHIYGMTMEYVLKRIEETVQ